MYLHLGQDVVVPTDTIIGIFDLDNTSASHITRKYLAMAQREGKIVNISDDLPKSFIVCEGEGSRLYLSQLSTATLLKRSENQEAI